MDSHQDRRAGILAAAWGIVQEHGIAGISFRRTAQRAGVSLGLVQHYFSSKEDLVRASAEAMIDAATLWHLSGDMSPRTAIRRVITHGIPTNDASLRGVGAWLSYVAAGVSDTEIAKVLTRAKRGQEDEAARLITLWRPDVDATTTARQLIAVADGLALRVLVADLSTDAAYDAIDLALKKHLDY
ncbi:TetR/AcrR family transcriptional regulator [Microbacterium sp.]|uniref:TetR/AcrR family transcriptional regulator n=1 Tax=Microbacterium sp. TaxID=51671 RepID=UPI002733EA44|nr:TetR/AcrR family transcriptional regulator [Microbacterium sp.]MDP3950064.1 TetR/AcrR family transcriptional regulator [Microbacterium sp.]